MRKFIAIVATLALLPVLTACANTQSTVAACKAMDLGVNAAKIEVAGASSTKPAISIKSALTTKVIETKVVTEGSGLPFGGNQMVKFDYVIANGTTGKEIAASAFDGSGGESQYLTPDQPIDLCHALSGAKAGSRLAILIPPGLMAQESTDQLKVTDSVILVLDVNQVYLSKVEGSQKASDNGMPTVVAAPSGQPGVTIPKTAAPAEFKMNTLIDGNGEAVSKGDTVTVQYSGFLWEGGTQFDSSWTNGSPAQFQVADGALISGFVKALVGARVGSRILAVIPPAEGYGAEGNGSIPGNATLVFVVDLLGVDKAK